MRRLREEEEILAAALALFVQQGIHGTSMQQVAERAGFSVGKLYSFFPSKADLFLGLRRHGLAEFSAAFAAAEIDDASPLAGLRAVLENAFAFVSSKRDLIRVEAAERIGRQDAERPIHELILARVRGLLARAVAEGELRPVDPELLATMILGAGEALVWSLAGTPSPDPYADIPDRIMTLMVLPHAVSRAT